MLTLYSLYWAVLQEKVTTTYYGNERWNFAIVLNTVQSTFAAISGYIYLLATTSAPSRAPIFPNSRILFPLVLVAVTQSLASPFGYAALAHVDYITYILAKSCKLLPVMALHVTIFRKKYPLFKYLVVAAVTAGVSVFTIYAPSKKGHGKGPSGSSMWGLTLLGVNLLFDGLTNSVQDNIKENHKGYSGQRMMVAQNVLSTLLTVSYLLLLPLVPEQILDVFSIPKDSTMELTQALDFMRAHPAVIPDVLGFCACGAVGQLFIYMTLARFSSLLLVMVTVTRKMLSMIFSVVWFGHRLAPWQWAGVALVFGAIGAEAFITKQEKERKERERMIRDGKKAQ